MASGTNGGIHGGAVCSLQDRLMYFNQRTTLRKVRSSMILSAGRQRKRSPADDASEEDAN